MEAGGKGGDIPWNRTTDEHRCSFAPGKNHQGRRITRSGVFPNKRSMDRGTYGPLMAATPYTWYGPGPQLGSAQFHSDAIAIRGMLIIWGSPVDCVFVAVLLYPRRMYGVLYIGRYCAGYIRIVPGITEARLPLILVLSMVGCHPTATGPSGSTILLLCLTPLPLE